MSRRIRSVVALAALAIATPTALATHVGTASAATVPSGFVDSLVSTDMPLPTDVTDLSDGRLLVTGQDGALWVIAADGTRVTTPAITITGLCRSNEQGLLGVDADPDFATNHYVYVYYTRGTASPDCRNRLSRLTMSGNTVVPGSELVLIDNIQSNAVNHEGGDVQFGKDGMLYVSSGDDADQNNNPQNLGNLMGKILRINPDGSIPASNPFQGADSASCKNGAQPGKKCQEIIAYGFRNPFRMAADPNSPGTQTDIFVNDVGLDTAEEIDVLGVGENYGWPAREGLCAFASRNDCHAPGGTVGGLTDPIYDYTHAATGCESITGGAFAPNGAWPDKYTGAYLYADYICGKIFALIPDGNGGVTNETFATGVGGVTSMRTVHQTAGWAIYYVTQAGNGELHKIVSTTPGGATLPSAFHPLTPKRVLDTRDGTGYTGRKPGAGDTISLQITGAGTGVPAEAKAVSLNLTGTESNAAGFVTAWPAGEAQPDTSALNFSNANDTVANEVIVRLGAGGQLNLFTQRGAHLVADITGYWTETAQSQAGRYVPAPNPARLLDTREGNGAPAAIVDAEQKLDVQVTGRGGVPDTGVSAVALVVTVTQSARSGFVTAWPTGQPMPLASSLNPVGANDIRSNLVIIPVGAGGKVSLFTKQPTHLVMDVAGWFTDGSAPLATTGLMVAASPVRLLDTRNPGAPFGRLQAGDTGVIDYSAAVSPSNAIALVHNLTVDGTQFAGFVTAYPASHTKPVASNVNWNGSNQIRASLTISSLGDAGRVAYFTNVGTDLVIDRAAWFIP